MDINLGVYNKLGKKVFWLYLWENSTLPVVLLLATIILIILDFQNFTKTFLGNIQADLLWTTLAAFVLFLIATAVSYILALLMYSSYTFMLDSDSLKIRRGIFSRTEDAIPYRQIQNVDIERSLTFRYLGLSRLVILTAGHEDEKPSQQDESEGIIPAIDKNIAEALQSELLKRANIQKTTAVV